MQIDIVFPSLPPALDGIGDYTHHLSKALARRETVVIHTAQSDALPIAGVHVRKSFDASPPHRIRRIVSEIKRSGPDWLLIQFNQFSYGRWGFNPFLPLAVRRIKKSCPGIKIAVMAHEDYVPPTNWKFALMRIWQRWQFVSLGRASDVFFFSIQPWVEQHGPSLNGTPAVHLPVGSNIPLIPTSRQAAKARMSIMADDFVLGVFGTLGASRMLDFIAHAVGTVQDAHPRTTVLYVGPDPSVARERFGAKRLVTTGALGPQEASVALSAMDVHLAPFIDGVSTRRGSFLAGIQHGVASVSTLGPLTDELLARENGKSMLLAAIDDREEFSRLCIRLTENAEMRAEIGRNGQALFDREFRWEAIAERLLNALEEYG